MFPIKLVVYEPKISHKSKGRCRVPEIIDVDVNEAGPMSRKRLTSKWIFQFHILLFVSEPLSFGGLLFSHDAILNRPNRLTQCCTQFKSPGVKILCALHLH